MLYSGPRAPPIRCYESIAFGYYPDSDYSNNSNSDSDSDYSDSWFRSGHAATVCCINLQLQYDLGDADTTYYAAFGVQLAGPNCINVEL